MHYYLHVKNINPLIKLPRNMIIPNKTIDLNSNKITVGISSFGFGGTNAHIILQSYENNFNLLNTYPKFEYNRSFYPLL